MKFSTKTVFLILIFINFLGNSAEVVRAGKYFSFETENTDPKSEEILDINPNALFWPVASVKNIDDRFYFLKIVKEKISGMFIFGNDEKTKYELFLASKRLLEVNSLLDKNRVDQAKKTLESFDKKFSKALFFYEKSLKSGEIKSQQLSDIKKSLDNFEIFLKWRKNKEDDGIKEEFDKRLFLIRKFLEKL